MRALPVTDTDILAKGGCYICGRADGLVSTEVDIEGEGVLCLCKGCIFDAAVAAGWTVEVNQAADLEEARADGAEWQARARKAEDALAAGVQAAAERLRDTANAG
jgi:hypothetical protein